MQAPPARVAPTAQSADVKVVVGVGSTHCVLDGPALHCWQAGWQVPHVPLVRAYLPSGHAEIHEFPESSGFTADGHVDLRHALYVHDKHSEAFGPEQVKQSEWHLWQTRCRSAE